jgi:hypothetical protein
MKRDKVSLAETHTIRQPHTQPHEPKQTALVMPHRMQLCHSVKCTPPCLPLGRDCVAAASSPPADCALASCNELLQSTQPR